MSKLKVITVIKNLKNRENMIMWIWFTFWFFIIITPVTISSIKSDDKGITKIIPILGGLIGVFFMNGILAFIYKYKKGIIPMKKIIKWIAKITIVLGIIGTILIYLLFIYFDYFDPPEDLPSNIFDMSTSFLPIMFLGIFLFLLLIIFILLTLMCYLFLVIGFGLVWILAFIERTITPKILVRITKITQNTSDSMIKKNRIRYLKYYALRWIFNIPDVLDTKTFTINIEEPEKKIHWSSFKKAIIWELFFGSIFMLNIIFNPLFLESMSIQELFGISGVSSIFIPAFILPFFIYLRLDASIKGPVKDFKLYNGIHSRFYQLIVAFGTLITFIRIALKDIDKIILIKAFLNYYVGFIAISIVITFVYFNYFENELAKDIAQKYDELLVKQNIIENGGNR